MSLSAGLNMLIGGEEIAGLERFPVINPSTEAVIGSAPDCTIEELDGAVAAARAAFPAWAALSIEKRRQFLLDVAAAIAANEEELARILTAEQGKPLADAREEVQIAAWWLQGAATLTLPVVKNEDTEERYSETRRYPIGVVGAIAPWNFPLVLAMFKVGPALLAGNTMVLKPSPFTPLSTLRFGAIVREIVPAGVLNIVSGSDRLGPWLTSHPGIDKVSFTGSTETGKRVMQSAAHSLKRLTLELGGNDAAIVLPDIDVEVVAEKLFWAAFRNNGQVCIATKRIYVHDAVYDALRDAMIDYARTVTIGDGLEQGVRLGPVNNRPQYERVKALIADSRDRGHDVITVSDNVPEDGFFLPVTFVDNPPHDSRIVQEEQFGPVVPLIRYNDIDAALALVNDSPFGLGGSVWGNDSRLTSEIADRISSGTVWINEAQYLTPTAAFGGMRNSGFGVEGGDEGLLEYTYAKTIFRRK